MRRLCFWFLERHSSLLTPVCDTLNRRSVLRFAAKPDEGQMVARRKPRILLPDKRKVVRRLKFDSLEDRKLLAGLSVFVFDDANGSGKLDSVELGAEGRVVFLDQDRDGTLDPSEFWALTDRHGRVSFDGLAPGDYWPVLFGANPSLVGTTQVSNAPSGELHVALPTKKVLAFESDHEVWLHSHARLQLVDLSNESIVREVTFDRPILDAVVAEEAAWVLLDNNGGAPELQKVDLNDHSVQVLPSVAGVRWTKLMATRSGVLIQAVDASQRVQLYGWHEGRFRAYTSQADLNGSSTIYSDPSSDFLFAISPSTVAGRSQLNVFQTESFALHRMASRELGPGAEIVGVDGANGTLAVRSRLQTTLLKLNPTLDDLFALGNDAGSLVFDSLRQQLRVYYPSAQELRTFETESWQLVDRSPLLGPSSLGQPLLSPNRERLVSLSSGGLYSLNLLQTKPTVIPLAAVDSVASVTFGQRSRGLNQAPRINQEVDFSLLEDSDLSFAFERGPFQLQDAERDLVGVFVIEGPKNGKLNWSVIEGGSYLPSSNFEGTDSIVVQAFDGRSWSERSTLALKVLPINDPPLAIETSLGPISEGARQGDALGVVTILDPDRDAEYRVTVSDPRLLVVDGVLRLAPHASLDFERESQLTFEIVATDQHRQEHSISRSLSVSIFNENEAPTSLILETQGAISENESGVAIGTLQVLDPDGNEEFRWLVSDARFVVVGSQLFLAPGVSFNYEAEEYVPLSITAIDRGGAKIIANLSIAVRDQNDAPQGLVIDHNQIIADVRGYQIGNVTVLDEDESDLYDFSVDDARFMFVGNLLQLKPNVAITDSSVSSLRVRVTAVSRLDQRTISDSLPLQVVRPLSPWQNPLDPLDVDGDGIISLRDPLIIINELNKEGIRILPPVTDGEPNHRIDVNGDGKITPVDVLIILNHLNENGISSASGSLKKQAAGEGEGVGVTPATADLSLASYLAEQDLASDSPSKQPLQRGQKRTR